MSRLARLAPLFIGFVFALFGAQSARADDPTLFVRYATNCTFTITGDNGGAINMIPPGRYQVVVTSPRGFAEPDLAGETDPNAYCGGSLSFRITGPGVGLHTTLEDGDAAFAQLFATFQVGTYVALEDRRPTVARLVFTVATNAPSTGGGTNTGSGGGTTTTTTTPKVPTTSPTTSLRGTLNGSVSTAGKLTLRLNGKTVASVKSGRYKLTVLDEVSSRGFTIQKVGKQATNVTGTQFVGRKSVTLTFNTGQWFYYSPSGKKTYFIVVG